MRPIIYFFAFITLLTSCLQDNDFNEVYSGFSPQLINDSWNISTPQKEGMDSRLLEKAYKLIHQDDRFFMARSLLVFRNGKLVAESYPNDQNDIHQHYNIQSCTKSITSILMGVAIQDQYIDSIEEKLYHIFPENFDDELEKREVTIQDALLMQTGLKFDNNIHTQLLYEIKDNSTEFVLSQDLQYQPGLITNYNDGAPHLISKVIENKTDRTLSQYAEERLFTTLGIEQWKWESSNDGTTFGAFSLFLKPRDLGKIAQLLIQNGAWQNEQLIDKNFLNTATSTLTSANFNSEPYGYYFWILPAFNGFCALGHGGQFLLIVPEKNLAAVYTAFPYTHEDLWDERNELMNLIVASCN